MHTNRFKKFLNGQEKPTEVNSELGNIDAGETDFVDAYQEVIHASKSQKADFDPFKKVKIAETKRTNRMYRILPYAATIALLIGIGPTLHRIYQNHKTRQHSEAELVEIRNQTQFALAQFSRELKECTSSIHEAKNITNATSEFATLKNIKFTDQTTNKNKKNN